MQSSAKSMPSKILSFCLFIFIVIAASRLDPISFEALFSSILKLQTSLIFSNCDHFSFNSRFSNFLGTFRKFSK